MLSIFPIDLPAYLKCTLSHAYLVVMPLWIALSGVSVRPDMIMDRDRSSILI